MSEIILEEDAAYAEFTVYCDLAWSCAAREGSTLLQFEYAQTRFLHFKSLVFSLYLPPPAEETCAAALPPLQSDRKAELYTPLRT